MKVCPKCGKEFKDDSLIFCPYCGSKLIDKVLQTNTCPYCGARIIPNASYCYKCGSPLPHIKPQNTIKPLQVKTKLVPPTKQHLVANKYAKRGTIFGIIALLIFSPLGIGAFYYGLKARKLNKNKGLGGIILGIAALIEGLISDIVLLFQLWVIPYPYNRSLAYLIWFGEILVICFALYYIYKAIWKDKKSLF